MAKVSNKKEPNHQANSGKLKTIAKTTAKTVVKKSKTLQTIKNVVPIKKGAKPNAKKNDETKKKVSEKTKVANNKVEAKSSVKKGKSHVESPEKTKWVTASSLSSVSNTIPSKKQTVQSKKEKVEQKKEKPSRVVTRRDSRENKMKQALKNAEKKDTNVPSGSNGTNADKPKTMKKVTFNVQATGPEKESLSKEPKKKSVVNKQRVASLNATCKVRMMYDCSDEQEHVKTKKKYSKKPVEKEAVKKNKVLVKAGIKRKNQDDVDASNIIDSRSSTKRVASLNASAILAALSLPEPPLPKPAPKSLPKTASKSENVKKQDSVREEQMNGALQIDVECLPPLKKKKKLVQQKSPVIKAISPKSHVPQKKNTQLQSATQLSTLKSATVNRSSPKVTGVTTTKLEVTKVQINSSGARKEKTDHQVKTILGNDFVRKYQIETNSSQSYCVQVHNSSVETHHQPILDPLRSSSAVLNVPPPAHMDSSTIMTTSQSLSSSFSPFGPHIQQPQAHTRPMMQVGSLQGMSPFAPFSILNIPHFALSGSHRTNSNLRPNAFGLPPPLDLSHGNYSPATAAAAAASSGFTLLGHSPMYQPAGPMIQSNDSSCLVHKPIPFHPPQSSHAAPFQPQITQSLSPVSGSIFAPPSPSGHLFHQQRLHQSSQHLQPCAPIFVSNVPQPNLGFFNHSSIRPSLPFIQGSGDNFASRNLPWISDPSPRTANVPSYPKGSSTKSTYQSSNFSRSPHIATVRPQVSKKQKEPVRSKKNASTVTTKEVVQRQPALPLPMVSPRKEIVPQQEQPIAQTIQTSPVAKTKKRFAHGWSWFGKRFAKRVFVHVSLF